MTIVSTMAKPRSALTRLSLLGLPVVISFFALFWPLFNVLLRSLNEKGRAAFEGFYFGHYLALMQDELLRQVVAQSLNLSWISTAVTVTLAFPAAYVISQLSKRASSLMMVLILMPFWVSIIVRLFAFTTILGNEGIVNSIASAFGVGPFPLMYNAFATIVGMVAYLLPYMILILVSAMSSIDTSLLTAARTMGASEKRVFFDIYFPQVKAALLGGSVIVFVLSLGFFLTPAILGGPQNITIPVFIQQQVQVYQWGKAAAMGIVLLLVSVLGYMLALRIGGRGMLSPVQQGSRGATAKEPLKLTKVTTLCLSVLVIDLIMLILPLLVVIPTAFTESMQIQFPPVGFSLKWFHEIFTSEIWQESFFKSVRVAFMTAICATGCGLALARVATRTGSRTLKSTIQILAITPLIVPVILLGIGIFDVQNRTGLIGTDLGLVIAHTVLCMPLTFLVLGNAISAVDISLEQAAWTMGAGNARAFFSVVVPSVTTALIGSMIISFVTSWDEAVLAMFQTDIDKTLPVAIYSFLKSGITPAVSAVAATVISPVLIVITIIAIKTMTTNRRG
ncbi:ABC transporter permease subunit [Pseudomonas sp. O230]|uniref:ABC transporter permease subunit n=1 Tax=Pseudomonas sp. O230 TaxID=3159450 RepID=UPI00387B71E8